jgi:hypothetical protein
MTRTLCMPGSRTPVALARGYHPLHSLLGIIWTAVTAAAMFTLAAGKARTGQALDNPVLQTEGRVTFIDGILAGAVLLGLILNAVAGWWWADPAAGYVLVYYAAREVRAIFTLITVSPPQTRTHAETAPSAGAAERAAQLRRKVARLASGRAGLPAWIEPVALPVSGT